MALQVWLPLTKDLRNQGLLNIPNFSLNAFTQEAGGKLGQYCYVDRGIIHFSEDFLDNQWSLACWVKSSGWSSVNDIILCKNATESTNSQFYLSIINGSKLNLGINGGSENGAGAYSYTFSTNTWYHVAATYDGINYAMYVNGDKVKSGTCATTKPTGLLNLGIGCRSTNATGTSSAGNNSKRLNDVRIYDHALSQMEVKQISQGLVLHYPLDNNGVGNENLIRDTDFSGVSKKYTVTSSTEGGFTYTPTETIIANTEYVVSCRLRGNANMNLYKICTGGNESMQWVNREQLSATEYKYFSIVFTYPSNKTLNQIYICTRYGSTNTQTGDWFEIEPCSLKLEKSSKPTPWCPNKNDTLYTSLGYNDGIEYDTSGFGNNGTRVGNFTYSSDSSRYLASTFFEQGVNSYIITPTINFDGKGFTASYWFKSSSTGKSGYQMPLSTGGNYEMSISPDGKLRGGIYVNGTRHVFNAGTSNYLDGEWHMFTMTYNGAMICRYVDGVLEHSETISGTATTSDVFAIGRHGASNTTYGSINLYESDVRIYATALSAEDVQKLYSVSTLIDSQGNAFASSYVEG